MCLRQTVCVRAPVFVLVFVSAFVFVIERQVEQANECKLQLCQRIVAQFVCEVESETHQQRQTRFVRAFACVSVNERAERRQTSQTRKAVCVAVCVSASVRARGERRQRQRQPSFLEAR